MTVYIKKPNHLCGLMTLASSYSKPHPCVKKVSKPGQICAHHRRKCHRRTS